jgi:hypothetical protein
MPQIINIPQPVQYYQDPQPAYVPAPQAQGGSTMGGALGGAGLTLGALYAKNRLFGAKAPVPVSTPAPAQVAPVAPTGPVPAAPAAPAAPKGPGLAGIKGFGINPAPDPATLVTDQSNVVNPGRISRFVNQAPSPQGLPPEPAPQAPSFGQRVGGPAPPEAPFSVNDIQARLDAMAAARATPEIPEVPRASQIKPFTINDIVEGLQQRAAARAAAPPLQLTGPSTARPLGLPAPPRAPALTTGVNPNAPRLMGPPPQDVNSLVRQPGDLARVLQPFQPAAPTQSAPRIGGAPPSRDAAAQMVMGDEGPVSARPYVAPTGAAPADLSLEAMAMSGEGGGSGMSRFFSNVQGAAPLKVAGGMAKGVGGLGMLAEGINQNAVIPALMGDKQAGAKAVQREGALTGAVEPSLMHYVANSYRQGDPAALLGAKAIGAGAADLGSRVLDTTGLPALAAYIGNGLGIGGGSAAPAREPAPAPRLQASQLPTGGHMMPSGAIMHPGVHTAEDFVNQAQAEGVTKGDLQRMWSQQHYLDPRSKATAALEAMEESRAAQTGNPSPYEMLLRQITGLGFQPDPNAQ